MKISIITVCFNDREKLQQTIENVAAQSYLNYEHIVVDGGSNDGSLEYLNSLKHSRLKFRSEPDEGLYDAMNKGIRHSSGDFMIFLNAGDLLVNNSTLSNCVEAMTQEPADFFYGEVILKTENCLLHRRYPKNISSLYLNSNFLCHQVCLFSKTLFNEFTGFDTRYRFAADFDFFARLWNLTRFTKKRLELPVAVYAMDGLSSNEKNIPEILSEIDEIRKKHFKVFNGAFLRGRIKLTEFLVTRIHFKPLRWLLKLCVLPFIEVDFGDQIYHEFPLSKIENASSSATPRVMHLSSHENLGGAAVAAKRLHNALLQGVCPSLFLVLQKQSRDHHVRSFSFKKGLSLLWANLMLRFESSLKKLHILLGGERVPTSLGLASMIRLDKDLQTYQPNLLHLHYIGANTLNLKQLSSLQLPFVWTLHDMWPFCGIEHLSRRKRFIEGYSQANSQLGEKFFDLSRIIWKRKLRSLNRHKERAIIVAPSRWMKEQAEQSVVFKDFKIVHVPHGIDSEKFRPLDKSTVRRELGLNLHMPTLLFGAVDIRDENKGFGRIISALKDYYDRHPQEKLQIALFGYHSNQIVESLPYFVRAFDFSQNPNELIKLYSASDIFISASLIESFGLTVQEAMSCGNAILCFDTSGLRDLVDHQENGFLANPEKQSELVEGLTWLLSDRERLAGLGLKAREKMIREFSSRAHANAMAKIYASLVERKAP